MRPPSPGTAADGRVAGLLADADRCVKCGLCLPHCPTYRETRDEGDSPRGRIALAQGLLTGRLPPGPRLLAHLDGCLACRSCEAVCPAGVPYGRIIDGVRAEVYRRRRPARLGRWLRRLAADAPVTRPAWFRSVIAALRAAQGTRLERLVRSAVSRTSPRLARLLRYLRRLPAPAVWAECYPAIGEARGEVSLFLGCLAREVDRETLEATVRVLRRLGYTVHVPPGQGCCGAIHLHAGAEAEGLSLVERNLRAFAARPGVPVVVTATGCAAQLVEYPDLPGLSPALGPAASELSGRVVEVCALLARTPWPAGLTLAPFPARVAVHEPCTLRNVLRAARAPYAVLQQIPALETVPLAGNGTCCGSAGAYMLTHPETADRLLEDKVDAIRASGGAVVATTNVGCALHLGAGLAAYGEGVEVLHPVVILDRQIREGPA